MNNWIILFSLLLFMGCTTHSSKYKNSICVKDQQSTVFVEKTVYKVGETVNVRLQTEGETCVIELRDISLKECPLLYQSNQNELAWEIPSDTPCHAIGVFIKNGTQKSGYATYFRVTNEGDLTTYRISKTDYQGLNVYQLDGGMSAEYAVQKSLSNLTSGISHTWKIGPGGGPSPVWGSPDFLEKSIQYTTQLYNTELGDKTPFETVIIATGVPSVPYLSATMKAPVLPLHFLASVNACKEVQSILDYSCSNGYQSYATLGYDASMDHVGVAWIKLLELPREYLDFIRDHQVKNVIFAGVGERVHGESVVQRVKNHSLSEEYADGSFYIQYTNRGSEQDMRTIKANLVDYDEQLLDTMHLIADWESGILDKQIAEIGKQIRDASNIQCYELAAPQDMGQMYNLSTYLSAKYIKTNETELVKQGGVKGVILNEYLISEPLYELINGYVPLLYWQFNPPTRTIDRIGGDIMEAIRAFYPNTDMEGLSYHVNARIGKKELNEELIKRSCPEVAMRADHVEEVWDVKDGMNAPCEAIALDIVDNIGVEIYKERSRGLSPLSISDLSELSQKVPGILFKKVE